MAKKLDDNALLAKAKKNIQSLTADEKKRLAEIGKTKQAATEEAIQLGIEAELSLAVTQKQKIQTEAGRFEALTRQQSLMAANNKKNTNIYLVAIAVNNGEDGNRPPAASEVTATIRKALRENRNLHDDDFFVVTQSGLQCANKNKGVKDFKAALTALRNSGIRVREGLKQELVKNSPLQPFSLGASRFLPEIGGRHGKEG